MKKNQDIETKISEDDLSNISPIKDYDQHLNTKTNLLSKKDEESEIYSKKYEDKDDLLSLSSEDIDTKMNRLIKIAKEKNKKKRESKDDIKGVNNILRTSKQKPTRKLSRTPISFPNQIANNINNISNENRLSSFGINNNGSINSNIYVKGSLKILEENKDRKANEKINESYIRKIQSKAKKLELLKKQKREYIDLIELQKKKKESEMKHLEEQISKQNDKYSRIYDGESVSNTDSILEGLNPNTQIENGLAILCFVFKNNLAFNKLSFIEQFNYLYGKKIDASSPIPVRNEKKRKTQKLMAKKGTMREDKKKENENEKEIVEENLDEIELYSVNEEVDEHGDDTFIKIHQFKGMDKPVIDKSQLVEYDLFYKQQFFTDELFNYDVENIQDKEEKEINKEMNKLDWKRRLKEKKKLKEVNDLKGLDTTELQEEINKLTKEYEKIKKVEEPKVVLELNNTEKLLQKGRILGFYFDEGEKRDYPHFSLRGAKEMGAEEIIDFKVLRKEEQARRFFDYSCCLEQRKRINKVMVNIRFYCRLFVDNPIFDYLSLFVIIANTVLILISDPTDSNNLGNLSDSYFLYFYTVESVFKILAFRFWATEDAYIKDPWNILDFFVVVVGWILYAVEKVLNGTKISGLAGLRAFRILRPLKTVKRFKGLKKLVTALLLSLGHLGETGIILFFFFLIFAIAGRQMWQGYFYRRCMHVNFGFLSSFQKDKQMCTFDSDCNELESYGIRYICAKGYRNPDMGAFNFDNVLTGFVTIFMMATLEGWSDIFTYVSKTFKDKIYVNPIINFFYFHFFIFLASFYLLKLFLAVTNAEYEHIEVSRRELTEKKSFYKLMQSKFDVKMKEKLEKKEKERQLKANNTKKSDEALRDLYYKVVDEAFQINKNRRNIPILYSTVKDMYIMSNNNPEEMYLQTLRIEDEEKFLSKDIKRQQREIDRLIDEKVKEMKNSAKMQKKEENIEEDEEIKSDKTLKENNDNNNNNNNKLKRMVTKGFSSKKLKLKNKAKKKKENILPEIQKKMANIKHELIELTIDGTLKYIKERSFGLSKMMRQATDKKEVKKENQKKKNQNQEIVLEDLPYEKEIKEKNEKEKKHREDLIKKKESVEAISKIHKKKSQFLNSMNASMKKSMAQNNNNDQKSNISDNLSFICDLSLSKNEEGNVNETRRNTTLNRINSYILDYEKEVKNEEKSNDVSINTENRNDITNKSLISNDDDKKEDNNGMLYRVKAIKLKDREDIFSRVEFKRPYSILTSVLDLQKDREIQEKMNKLRNQFKLDKYLEKEAHRGVNVDSLGRRKSFLDFLQYTEKKKNINDYLKEVKEEKEKIKKKKEENIFYLLNRKPTNKENVKDFDNESNKSDDINRTQTDKKSKLEEIIEDKYQNNISFLSRDSNLTIDNNVSLDDINLLPHEMKEINIFVSTATTKETIKKNLESNKLTQLMRSSVFDRNAVNTNINLTSKEQTDYFKLVNRNLNKNLYTDLCQPRGRKHIDLNVSCVREKRDYGSILDNHNENIDEFKNKAEGYNEEGNDEIKVLESERVGLKTITNNEKENKEHNNNFNEVLGENQKAKGKDKKGGFYIFKAKSIEKNIIKYPYENSNDFLVREENRPYTDPLTIKQESISDNLRGKKFYMNYLYNIIDKDLKVKDTFDVRHWEKEVYGRKDKFFKKKPLPESIEAFFVFNDKDLELKKYIYTYHKDKIFEDNEYSVLTHNLKYLPNNVLQLLPMRIRNFGKYFIGKDINAGALGNKANSMNLMTFGKKSHTTHLNTRSGKNTSTTLKNKSTLIISSSFMNHYKTQEEIKMHKGLYERIYKRIDELNYRTLSHYFLNEEQLNEKFLDSKKKEEKMKEILEYNKNKQNRLEVKSEIMSIKLFDYKTNSNRYMVWSGSDVLVHLEEDDNRKRWNNMIYSLENFNIIVWNANAAVKNIQKIRYAFYLIATNDYFDITVLAVVLINSVFMAIDGNIIKPEVLTNLNISNYVFNAVYMFEYLVKFVGLSPIVYYSDAFTYLDTFIIVFSIIDMASPTEEDTDSMSGGKKKNVSSQLSFLRVFRIFRVVRLTKILRRIKSMRLIIVSITKAILNVSYIICIILMFILIFQLLGMSLLSGNYHYQSFLEAFYTTYQILTLEGWNELLVEIWPMNPLCFFYFLAWIILGNFVLFNLFISVLLQSFGEGGDKDEDDLTDDEKIEKMFSLPDYLLSIKESARNKKALEKLKRRNQFDAEVFQNSNTKSSQIQNSVSKSQFAGTMNMNSRSFINDADTKEFDSEDNIEEEEIEEVDEADNNKTLTKVEKSIKEWQRVNKLFKKNECENSLYILAQTNKYRIFCMKLIMNKWFDRVILIVILLSTARLIADTFVKGYFFVFAFEIVDAIFNIIFLLEAVFKISALGFILDEGSYLRDNWNRIDIIIVLCSIFDFQNLFTKYIGSGASSSSLQFLKVLRLLRTLRPLRFISHNMQLKLIITSLFESILPICTALFIVLVVYYIFSIVGISIFYTSFHNCYVMKSDGSFKLAISSFENNLIDYEINNDMASIGKFCADKYNGIMDTGPSFKYSNIATSLIASYVLSTQEGWPTIMNTYRIYSDLYGLFFLAYNLLASYFVLNLFTGIMFRYFNEAYKKETKLAADDKKAPKYYDFLNQIVSAESHYVIWVHPDKETIRYYLREFADSTFLDNFIMIIIGLNMISMAMVYENCHPTYDTCLTIANYIFTGIFIAECCLKLLAYGIVGYFHTGWNKFDFFVVAASILDLIIGNIEGIDAAFLKSFQIIRVLRVLRVTRVLRLVKSLKNLEKLIQTLSWSIAALENVILLMIIIFSIFSILGVYFYDGINYEDYKNKLYIINEYYNLDNFYNAFLFVFRCATGEKWPNMMMELAFVDLDIAIEAYAYIYMIICNFFTGIIMLNLFLMVTLQQYDEFTGKKYNPIEKFESFLVEFNNAWNKYSTKEDSGFRIKKGLVTNFFMDFNWKKLNFPDYRKLEHIKKYVSELKLRTDDEDNVYYLDIVYKVIVRQMGSQIDRTNPDNLLIFKTEKKVAEEVKNIINKYIGSHQKNQKGPKNNLITFNPYTSHLYFKISYVYLKTFLNFYKENSDLLRHMDNDDEANKPDDDYDD